MTIKNKNDQFSITRMWKKHRQKIALATTISLLAMGGAGIGIGYAIWHNNSDAIPVETSIKIYGPNSTNGYQGVAGSINYNAINNIGKNITANAKWKIFNQPKGVSIFAGVLSWDDKVPAGTYNFLISCISNSFFSSALKVTLILEKATHTYTLEGNAKVLDWNREKPFKAEFTMKVDGTIIDEKDVTLSISEGDSNVTITNNTITYDKIPVNSILPIDVIATYDGNVAMAYIILDNFIPTNILLPNDPAWVNLFNISSGTLNPTNIVDSNHWLQNQNQYDTIDLSCFDVIYGGAFATFDDLDSYGTKNFTITLKNQTKKTTIDNGAFNSCTKIIDFILPNSEVSIGSNTFGNCKNLKKITAGSSTDVTSLGTGSFMNCESLEEIDFTNSTLTTLATSAFQNCKNLKMIKLPSTCTIFNYSTLSNCTNLTDLYYRADSAPSIYSGGAFFDVAEGGTLHINATYAKTLGKTTGNAVTEWNGLTKWTYAVD